MFAAAYDRIQNVLDYFRLNPRNRAAASNHDSRGAQIYRYFPNNEQNYFADNFILGSEKFETLHPETFLFGDNGDLNYLNPEPLQVPFNLSMELSPVYPIRSLIHVRPDTIRLVRNPSAPQSYRIEFFFDCDIPVEITVHCLVKESYNGNNSGGQMFLVNYAPANQQFSITSPSYQFPSGGAQLFSKSDFSFTPNDWPADCWVLNSDPNSVSLAVPVVVRCRTTLSSEGSRQQRNANGQSQQQQQQTPQQEHIVLIGLDKSSSGDGSFLLKTARQKLVDYGCGCVFLLHQLYGAENKQVNNMPAPVTTVHNVDEQTDGTVPPIAAPVADDSASELDDSAGECVVCMSSERDTVLLPCRHLCVCATCAESLRSQCADCPICRLPFKALLRLRAVQPANPTIAAAANTSLMLSTTGIDPGFAMSSPTIMNGTSSQIAGTSGTVDAIGENTPPGYSSVSLMEALYGAYAANWRKSRPGTANPPLAPRGDIDSPLATASMATPRPTRQTPVFGRQSHNENAEDGTKNAIPDKAHVANVESEISGVNLAFSDDV